MGSLNNKKLSNVYIILLTISVLIYVLPPKLKWAVYTPNFLGYILLGSILLTVLLLVIILIINIKRNGVLNGIKETSLKIALFLLGLSLCYYVTKEYNKQANKVAITFINGTQLGITNIKLFGRGNQIQIDTLAPKKSRTILFYGKNVNRQTENDYENEIELRFRYNKELRQKKILTEFSRWNVLPDKFNIIFHSGDSISITK